jgi:FkbM family methyltransferase
LHPTRATVEMAEPDIRRSAFERAFRGITHRVQYLVVRHLRRRASHAPIFFRLVRLAPWGALRVRLFRSFAWPVAADLGTRLEVPTDGGAMVVDTSDLLGRVVAVSRVWEPNITDVFRRTLRDGDVCVDVGAHVGYYTLLASRLVGPRGHVYAIEPSARNVEMLRSSIALNSAANVTVFEVAAAAGDGTAVLFEAPCANTGASSLSQRAVDTPAVGSTRDFAPTMVSVRAVADLVPSDLWGRVRLVKVDVEGYELEVLEGLEPLLALGSPIALIVEVSPEWTTESPGESLEQLRVRHGFTVWRLFNDYTLEGLFPLRAAPPRRVRTIPNERCDLLFDRGVFHIAEGPR